MRVWGFPKFGVPFWSPDDKGILLFGGSMLGVLFEPPHIVSPEPTRELRVVVVSSGILLEKGLGTPPPPGPRNPKPSPIQALLPPLSRGEVPTRRRPATPAGARCGPRLEQGCSWEHHSCSCSAKNVMFLFLLDIGFNDPKSTHSLTTSPIAPSSQQLSRIPPPLRLYSVPGP